MSPHDLFIAYLPFACLFAIMLAGFIIVHVFEARQK